MNKYKRKINKTMEKYYLQKLRKKLTNEDFTIVCNNCVGGVIYHNLGMQFISPTIDLFLRGKDYLEFVKNFEYYSKCDIDECFDDGMDYPVGVLVPNDEDHIPVKVFFQHYKSFDEAKNKWIERYSRVNYKKVLFIWEFYDTIYDNNLMYEFDQLENKNKVILTHRKFEGLKNDVLITCYTNDEPVAKILEYKGISGKRYLEEFDYVKYLNEL